MKGPSRTALTITATAFIVIAAAGSAVASLKHYDQQAAAGPAAGSGSAPSASATSPALPKVVQASLPATPASYLGVYEGSDLSASQLTPVEQFGQAVGRQPNVVLYYSSWGEPFSISFAQAALKDGATLLADVDPTSVSCASIAAGEQDAYLASYARSVKSFGKPVIISFGHEMNGNWYPWGWTHTQPADFVQAWRHIVDVFRDVGADNVTWLWTVNSVNSTEGPIADYWPGADYVTWVAFDAYYYFAGDDFSGVFGGTIAAIRQITNKPIIIGETAVGQVAGQAAEIPGLFAGVASTGLLGLVWYDQNDEAEGGIYKQDWQLEGDPSAVSAFRAAVAQYLAQPATSASSPPSP
jgi:mannan endo-1,4-beta-mannosidase